MLFDSFEAYDVQETRRASRAEGKAEAVLELLLELGTVPQELQDMIMGTANMEKLGVWLKLAAKAESIEQFQEQAGL